MSSRIWNLLITTFTIGTCLFLSVGSVLAVELNISSPITQITSPDSEFLVNVYFGISKPDDTKYYFRGAFNKPGNTSSTCGYTWNDSNWYNGPFSNEGYKLLLPISIKSASWSGQLRAKFDSSDSSCKDNGTYNFRIQRYTFEGSASYDSNILNVEINIPTPSPTLTPSPTDTSTPTTSPAAIPSPTSTKTPTPKPTITPSSTPKTTDLKAEVLGASDSGILLSDLRGQLVTEEPKGQDSGNKKTGIPIVSYVLVSGGVMFIASALLLYWKKNPRYNKESDQKI